MQVSIVIPVWNGISVISKCLDAVYAHSGDDLLEIICVDNASLDDSAALIAERYQEVRLISQPVNLGFAGGVNAGIDAARGDVFVLLNQDVIVHPGWLSALVETFDMHPEFGIAGCTVLNADGTVNHTGAIIRRPDAFGIHLTDIGDGHPRQVEYVTGACYAIRRETWNVVGRFDEGYYPAYYEDSDYCYRARRKGIETVYVPEARVTHLFINHEWQADLIKHTVNQHIARYRFISKHFNSHEVKEFFEAESEAAGVENSFEQAVGRAIAARYTLRSLADILERRRSELGDTLSPTHRRQLQVGFTHVLRRSLSVAKNLGQAELPKLLRELSKEWEAANQRLQEFRQREYDLLTRIYFKSPLDDRPEPILRRLFRLFVLCPLSFIIGRDYLLRAELNTVHVARMDKLEQVNRLYLELIRHQLEQRLSLLEILTDYEYR